MRKFFNIGIIFAAVISIAAGWALITPYFAIKRVEFFGLQNIGEDEIALPFHYGDNLLLLSTEFVKNTILADSRIERIEVHKKLPDGVEIIVAEKTPSYLLNCGEIWGITRRGCAIPITDPRKISNLPLITTTQVYRPIPYKKVNEPSVLRALKFANKISDKNPSFLDKISEIISQKDGEYSLFLAQSGIEVSLSDKTKNPIKKLAVIIRELGSDKKDVVQIDMRFPEQGIVRFREGREVNKQSGRSS